MTVKELIDKLKDMPQDYIVQVLYEDHFYHWITADLDGDVAVADAFRGIVCIS